MVHYGKHLTVISGIGIAQSRMDALLISTFLPLTTMADYSVASIASDQFKQLWNVYVTMRYPPLVRLSLPKRRRRMLIEGTLMWVGFIVAGLMIIILAHWLIPIVLPPTYANSLGYLNWLVAAAIASIPGGFAEMYFRTEQDERRQYAMRIGASVAGVITPLLLFFILGAYGVVIGRFLAACVLSVLGVYLALTT
jgi:O-antigen/teichoic acid export membrane protein